MQYWISPLAIIMSYGVISVRYKYNNIIETKGLLASQPLWYILQSVSIIQYLLMLLWNLAGVAAEAPAKFQSNWTIARSYNTSSMIFYHPPGPWFNIKMSSYQYRKSHCWDKMVIRSSYLHSGIFFTGKLGFSYWIRARSSKIMMKTITSQENLREFTSPSGNLNQKWCCSQAVLCCLISQAFRSVKHVSRIK